MKPYLKPLLLTASLLLFLLFIVLKSPARAGAAHFPTFEEVQQMITNALSPVQTSLQALSNRVSNLEATVTPTPTPPFKGIWVSVAAISDPGGLGYYFAMSPRIVSNNFQTLYNSYQQLIADCWATVHFSNGDAIGLNSRRDDPLQIVSPNRVLPTDGTKIPTDLNCSWGGSTLQFHFDAVWDVGATSSQIHTSY